MSEEKEMIILEGEDGSKIQCEFGDRFSADGNEYVILIPYMNGFRDDDGILLMQTVKDEDDPDVEYLVALQDPDSINTVFSEFIRQKALQQHKDGTCFETQFRHS